MLRTFLREKPAKVLMTLKDSNTQWHLSKIARASGTTYVYVTGLASELARRGLITIENKGKLRVAKLTQKGAEVAGILEELRKKLE